MASPLYRVPLYSGTPIYWIFYLEVPPYRVTPIHRGTTIHRCTPTYGSRIQSVPYVERPGREDGSGYEMKGGSAGEG